MGGLGPIAIHQREHQPHLRLAQTHHCTLKVDREGNHVVAHAAGDGLYDGVAFACLPGEEIDHLGFAPRVRLPGQ